jgi:hypothetical protein
MSTKRYSGNVVVTIDWIDSRSQYRASVSAGGSRGKTIHVGAPRAMQHAVDSPQALDDAARAAISFAADEGVDVDGVEYSEHGAVVVHRKKPSNSPRPPRGFIRE